MHNRHALTNHSILDDNKNLKKLATMSDTQLDSISFLNSPLGIDMYKKTLSGVDVNQRMIDIAVEYSAHRKNAKRRAPEHLLYLQLEINYLNAVDIDKKNDAWRLQLAAAYAESARQTRYYFEEKESYQVDATLDVSYDDIISELDTAYQLISQVKDTINVNNLFDTLKILAEEIKIQAARLIYEPLETLENINENTELANLLVQLKHVGCYLERSHDLYFRALLLKHKDTLEFEIEVINIYLEAVQAVNLDKWVEEYQYPELVNKLADSLSEGINKISQYLGNEEYSDWTRCDAIHFSVLNRLFVLCNQMIESEENLSDVYHTAIHNITTIPREYREQYMSAAFSWLHGLIYTLNAKSSDDYIGSIKTAMEDAKFLRNQSQTEANKVLLREQEAILRENHANYLRDISGSVSPALSPVQDGDSQDIKKQNAKKKQKNGQPYEMLTEKSPANKKQTRTRNKPAVVASPERKEPTVVISTGKSTQRNKIKKLNREQRSMQKNQEKERVERERMEQERLLTLQREQSILEENKKQEMERFKIARQEKVRAERERQQVEMMEQQRLLEQQQEKERKEQQKDVTRSNLIEKMQRSHVSFFYSRSPVLFSNGRGNAGAVKYLSGDAVAQITTELDENDLCALSQVIRRGSLSQ